ncbi:hypothetical protein Ahy_B02g058853 isoform B [Arachis hypogaea]|uniref:Mitochondrial inner membrane protease ATP23 n=1 Tax=Arachis hypogaea TaxID=3818 RepID=A0A445AFI9_ARAHY|nr:hypothetical protein Ahy_B02g058853 isoform B [Arachis hypogaea]
MAQEPSSPGGSLGVKAVDEVQAMIQKSLELPKVKHLRQRMAEAGCAVKDNFFRAVVCQGRKGMAYFAPGHGIFVCSNHVRFQDEVNQLIIHELIHAYDDCRAVNLHWNNCAHQACSEVPILKCFPTNIKLNGFLYLITFLSSVSQQSVETDTSWSFKRRLSFHAGTTSWSFQIARA